MSETIIKGRKNSKIPSYVDVYNQLYRDIESGVFPKGSLLTSENQLSEKYHVSRNTLRQALAVLTQDGYIYKQQGKGTFVSYDAADPPRAKLYNYLLEATRENIIHVEMDFNISLPTAVARHRMRLPEGVEVLASNNVYQTEEGPIGHSFIQVPMSYIVSKGLDAHSEEVLYTLMNETIYMEGKSAEISLQCIYADDQSIPFLKIDKTTSILYLEQLIYDVENMPIARVKYHLLAGKYNITFHL